MRAKTLRYIIGVSLRTALYTAAFVLAISMVVTLLVYWNVYIISDYRTIKELYSTVHGGNYRVPTAGRWTVLIVGIVFLALLMVVLSIFFANFLRGNRFKQQQRDFANMVTHELRLPLSSIQVFAQTLRQRAMDPDAHNRFIDGILSECGRLGVLIDHLLKLQQIEQGKLPLHRMPLDAGGFLEEFAGKWPRPLAIHAEIKARVQADPMLLHLALANLVSNAEKYGRGSMPEITLSRADRDVFITVRDRGRPIPRKYLKRIFKKFYRVPNAATRRQNGVGLGLYIVKNIAVMHRGSVQASPLQASDSQTEGNAFTLSLPALP
jgi:two-component system phosphate regulon sensor histidine kinase PhoR